METDPGVRGNTQSGACFPASSLMCLVAVSAGGVLRSLLGRLPCRCVLIEGAVGPVLYCMPGCYCMPQAVW